QTLLANFLWRDRPIRRRTNVASVGRVRPVMGLEMLPANLPGEEAKAQDRDKRPTHDVAKTIHTCLLLMNIRERKRPSPGLLSVPYCLGLRFTPATRDKGCGTGKWDSS